MAYWQEKFPTINPLTLAEQSLEVKKNW